MAIFKNSTFGSIKKSIGDDVAYKMGGQNIIRKKPASFNDANTVNQQAQRNAFSHAVRFFRENKQYIVNSFPERLQKHSAFNAFMASGSLNAFSDGADFGFDAAENLVFAKGSLPVNFATGGGFKAQADLHHIVKASAVPGLISVSDFVVFTLVNAETFRVVKQVKQELSTSVESRYKLEAEFAQARIGVFAHYMSADGRKCSDSVLVGQGDPTE